MLYDNPTPSGNPDYGFFAELMDDTMIVREDPRAWDPRKILRTPKAL